MTETTTRTKNARWTAALFIGGPAIAAVVFFWIGRATAPHGETDRPTTEDAPPTTYYCAMHTHIRQDRPRKCPICSMDLVALEPGGDFGLRQIEISEAAMRRAEIETARVERRAVHARIRMPGKVDFDESRVKVITAWVPGRLDRLYVDSTGVRIKKGEHLVDIYSPALLVAQQRLIESIKRVRALDASASAGARESALGTLEAARENLRNSGLTQAQVGEIETRGTANSIVLITAPMGGVVVDKLADEGMFVDTGNPIYRIADLSRVWVLLDAFESDLTWLRFGQEVEFATEAHPGEVFNGKITFIDWVVGEKTRSVKARVTVDNSDGRLKPGMFVRAVVESTLYGGGAVLAPHLKGKWISPMHPEIVKDAPGKCDVCGMKLVPAEELFGPIDTEASPPLVIPDTAPLITGKRAVVYTRTPGRDTPTFEGRDVVLGPHAGDEYIVLAGLSEGDEVVVRGNFKIDSQLQIEAKRSMMNPEGGRSGAGHQHHGRQGSGSEHGAGSKQKGRRAPSDDAHGDHGAHGEARATTPAQLPAAVRAGLAALRGVYFDIAQALAADRTAAAAEGFKRLTTAVATWNDGSLGTLSQDDRHAIHGALAAIRQATNSAKDAGGLRTAFGVVSATFLELEVRFGHADGTVFYEAYCPMAFDNKGAAWLQKEKKISNPYFGASMLHCGEIRKTFAGEEVSQ